MERREKIYVGGEGWLSSKQMNNHGIQDEDNGQIAYVAK